ncbi:MAG: hypothetical protein FJ078_01025 [Cyanobacteria bacterium K_DeepCast_35m_m2_155]|nr:hypothetical protein [Cyanobacteria bacterium K_DeepCast_35m_m2_155]
MKRSHHQQEPDDDDLPLVDPGRNLGLRLLALVGALSFLMLGLASVLVPLLQLPRSPMPVPKPEPRTAPLAT